MVVRTWEQASKATTLQKVVVATDDERIAEACRQAGAEVVMTSSECRNGVWLTRIRSECSATLRHSTDHCIYSIVLCAPCKREI